ncbi:MAG: acylphosphatase [Calditrichaeota bacterium]|nr:MAG: acylphosphatase [Calditrichota bacterium]MBL1204189.1 acylphosphatase [Calditrichota bacterium]NOG44019.1 acylphosphatase [Calditrichota bacterium]
MKIFAYKYIVEGRVQGVGFRWFVLTAAQKLNILGTVRNTRNGNVEIFAQGTINNLEQFKSNIKKGPALSRVDSIKEVPENINDSLKIFEVVV